MRRRKKRTVKRKHRQWGVRRWQVMTGLMVVLLMGVGWLVRRWGLGRATWQGLGMYRVEEVVIEHAKVQRIYIWEVSEEARSVNVWEVPTDLVAQVVGFPGRYRLGAVYDLSLQETGQRMMLERTSAYTLGLLISRSVVAHDVDKALKPAYLSHLLLQAVWQGSLPIEDWWSVRNVINTATSGEVKPIRIADLPVLTDATEVDGSRFVTLNETAWDTYYEKSVPVPSVKWRAVSAYLYNTTGEAGLATTWARLLMHQGLYVRGVGDRQEQLDRSKMIVSKTMSNDPLLTTGLTQLMPGAMLSEGDTTDERSEVVVWLGQDVMVGKPKR